MFTILKVISCHFNILHTKVSYQTFLFIKLMLTDNHENMTEPLYRRWSTFQESHAKSKGANKDISMH